MIKIFEHEVEVQCDEEVIFWQEDYTEDCPGVFSDLDGYKPHLLLVEINAKEFEVGDRIRITIEKVV